MSEGQRTKNPFRWDHNHGTDEFRGFLCDSCNTSLGKFRDDPDLLARAIKYLGGGIFNSAQRTSYTHRRLICPVEKTTCSVDGCKYLYVVVQ